MTAVAATAPARRRWFGQLGVDTAYLLAGFPLGVVAFVLIVTGLSAGMGLLAAFLVGIPVLVGTLFVARGFAEIERARLAPVLRRPRVAVRYRRARPDAGWVRRLFAPFGEGQYWLDALHALLRFPITILGFVVTVTWWSTALGGLSYGLWDWALPHDINPEPGLIMINDHGLPEALGIQNTTTNRILIYVAIGALFAITLPFVLRIFALLEAWVAYGMLNGVAGLRSQVAGLAEDRAVARAQTAACARCPGASPRRSSPTEVWPPPSPHSPRGRPCRCGWRSSICPGSPTSPSRPPTSRSPRR